MSVAHTSAELSLGGNVFVESNFTSQDYDAVVLVLCTDNKAVKLPQHIDSFVEKVQRLDKSVDKDATLWHCEYVSGERLVLSPTGKVTPYDDARTLYRAARSGIQRALKAGAKKPLLIVQAVPEFPDSELVLILGALEAFYVPLQVRDSVPDKRRKFERFGVYSGDAKKNLEAIVRNAIGLERARIVARDIGSGDPERMTAMKVVEYVSEAFAGEPNVSVKVIDNYEQIQKEYPLLAAVGRAANQVERHRARVVQLEYVPTDAKRVTETLMLVGKGVTYDTGGADVKISSLMVGMSRDKCGAAAVAGFLKACASLKPAHLKAIGVLCLARNSIGEESYLADELLISRGGARVRIGNTDAEGRLVMADSLHEMKERATREVNPHLYTIATLTGHARRTYGLGYSIAMDNHVANDSHHGHKLLASGSRIGDPFEVSLLRPEDFDANKGLYEGDDIMQLDFKGRIGKGCRGHQVGAGFMILAGGLEGQGLKYTHLDIAASAGDVPDEPTAVPILALSHLHKLI